MFCPDIISLYFGDPWWLGLGSKFSQLLLYLPRFGLTVALEATIFTRFIRIAQRLFDPFKHRLNTLERQISDPEKQLGPTPQAPKQAPKQTPHRAPAWPGLLVGIRRPSRALATETKGHLAWRLAVGGGAYRPWFGEGLEYVGSVHTAMALINGP